MRIGFKKGDRLAFYLYNCPEIIICYFACFKIGITVIPINYRLKEDEAHYIIDHSKPSVLISQKSLFSQIADNIPELPSIEFSYLIDSEEEFADTLSFSDLMNPVESPISYAEIPGKTEAAVLYTSGTTGKPKGAVLAHDQMLTHTVGHCKLVNYQPQDRTLVCLALSNNFAFSHQMLSALYAGATLEINATFDPDEVLEKIERSSVTMLYMMPVMFHALNKQAAVRNLPIPNQLRLAIVAGDTTPFVVLNRFKEIFGLEMCEGETVHAFVALKPEADTVSERELLDFTKEHLADYKLPESITFIEELPKGATGKIDRKLLKQGLMKNF